MRISDWSSDVSLPISAAAGRTARRDFSARRPSLSRLLSVRGVERAPVAGDADHQADGARRTATLGLRRIRLCDRGLVAAARGAPPKRSEEHTSELQSLMRISSAVFGLTKKKST